MPVQLVVAEIVRSVFVEGHHYGSGVALGPDRRVDAAAPDGTGLVRVLGGGEPVGEIRAAF